MTHKTKTRPKQDQTELRDSPDVRRRHFSPIATQRIVFHTNESTLRLTSLGNRKWNEEERGRQSGRFVEAKGYRLILRAIYGFR